MADLTGDIFDNHYFRLTKFWISIMGVWPFSSSFRKKSIRTFVLLIQLSGMPTLIAAPFSEPDNYKDIVIQIIPPFCTSLASVLKYSNLIMNERTIRECLLKIQQDHLINGRTIGRQHLLDFSEKGRKFTYFYSTYLVVSMVLFLLFPHLPVFLDIINPLNETRARRTIFPVEYGIDMNKYYSFVILHESVYVLLSIFSIICSDILFMTIIFHACGLFELVSYNLCHFADDHKTSASSSFSEGNESERICANAMGICNRRLVHGLMTHKETIEYADKIRKCFTNSLFAIVVINMVVISLTGYQVIMKQGQWEEIVTAIIYTFAELLHLFTLSLPGQFLINSSETVGEAIYDSKWYSAPLETQKMLSLVLIRARSPCLSTAGNFFVLRMDTFATILQTSLSYFMVLANTR